MKKIHLVMVHNNTNGVSRVVAAYQSYKKAQSCEKYHTKKHGNVDKFYWIMTIGISTIDYSDVIND